MSVNLLTKAGKTLDQSFSHGLYTEKAVNQDYDFTGAKTVEVLTVETQPLTAYNRAGTGDRYGGNKELQDTKATYTLSQDLSFKIAIDKGNYQDQAELKKAGKVMKIQMNEQVYPAIDKNRFATLAAATATNGQIVTFDSANGYDNTLDAGVFLDEAQAPLSGQFMFVSPDFYKAVKKDIVTGMDAPQTNDKLIQKGFVGELDGRPVIKVPTSYFPVKHKAFLFHKSALLAPKKINEARIITDSEMVSGSLLIGRFYFDSFVLEAKKNAVSAIVEA